MRERLGGAALSEHRTDLPRRSADGEERGREIPPIRATNVIVGLYLGVAVAEWLGALLFGQRFFAEIGLVIPAFLYGTPFGLLSLPASAITHAGHGLGVVGPFHVIANVMLVLLVGPIVETRYGRTRTLLVYVVAAIVGSIASAALRPADAFYAASVGSLGLVGLLVAGVLIEGGPVPRLLEPRWSGVLALAVFGVLLIGVVEPFVSTTAHVGGLLAGALLAMVLPAEGQALARDRAAIGLGGLLAGLASLLLILRWSPDGTLADAMLRAEFAYEAQELVNASSIVEQALATDPSGSAALALQPLAQNFLAWLYVERNANIELGLTLAREANRLRPDTPAFLDTLGYLYALAGRCSEANDAMGKAAAIEPAYQKRRDAVAAACAAGERPDPAIPVEPPPEVASRGGSIQARAAGSVEQRRLVGV